MTLAKRNKVQNDRPYPEEWVVSYEFTANGRKIANGTELSFKNERGRFRFIKHVVNGEKEWLDVRADEKNGYVYRSFSPDSIRRVHYKNKTRANRVTG